MSQHALRRRWLYAVCFALLTAETLAANPASVRTVQSRVDALIPADVLREHGAPIADFVRGTCAALTRLDSLNDNEADAVASAIVDVVESALAQDPTPEQLGGQLSGVLEQRKRELASVTREHLARDWGPSRSQFARDARAIREMAAAVLNAHSILIVDPLSAVANRSSTRTGEPSASRPATAQQSAPKLLTTMPDVIRRLDETVEDVLGQTGRRLGNIFLPNGTKYSGPMTDEQRVAVKSFLSGSLVFDDVVVLGPAGMFPAMSAVQEFLLGGSAPKTPDLAIRTTELREAFELVDQLKGFRSIPNDWSPIVIGGKVPDDMRSGVRFRTGRTGAKPEINGDGRDPGAGRHSPGGSDPVIGHVRWPQPRLPLFATKASLTSDD